MATKKYVVITASKPMKLDISRGMKHRKLIASPSSVRRGTSFQGEKMYLRMKEGFVPVIKAMSKGRAHYFKVNEVAPSKSGFSGDQDIWESASGRNPYAIPTAGEMRDYEGTGRNPNRVSAGEIEGDDWTRPEVHDIGVNDIWSGASGWGVQAGQIYRQDNAPRNPMQVEAGEIEGVHETDSHIYSSASGRPHYGVQAGVIAEWMKQDNPYQVEGGEIEGNRETMPESFEYAAGREEGWNKEPYLYPQLYSEGYANPDVEAPLPEYAELYPQYSASGEDWRAVDKYHYAEGDKNYGVQAGVIAEWMKQDNPYRVEGGEIEGNIGTMPEIFEYATGKTVDDWEIIYEDAEQESEFSNLTAEERKAKRAAKREFRVTTGKKSFWESLFGTKESRTKKRITRLEKKIEYTESEVKKMHKRSATKKSLGDWLRSEEGKNTADSISTISALLLGRDITKEDTKEEGYDDDDNGDDDDDGKKNRILGMHPVTFGLIAGIVVIGGVVTVILVTRKKKGKS